MIKDNQVLVDRDSKQLTSLTKTLTFSNLSKNISEYKAVLLVASSSTPTTPHSFTWPSYSGTKQYLYFPIVSYKTSEYNYALKLNSLIHKDSSIIELGVIVNYSTNKSLNIGTTNTNIKISGKTLTVPNDGIQSQGTSWEYYRTSYFNFFEEYSGDSVAWYDSVLDIYCWD